jgi:hypothetical protein
LITIISFNDEHHSFGHIAGVTFAARRATKPAFLQNKGYVIINFMHIEFHNPQAQVKKWVLDYVTDKLIELYQQQDKKILSAEVYYREQVVGGAHNKICEIVMAACGTSLFVHRSSASFEQSSRAAVADLTERIEEASRRGVPIISE